MDNSYINININSSVESESEFVSCYVTLSLIDVDTDIETEIGNGTLYIINVFRYNNWSEIIYAADVISGDMCSIVESLEQVIDEEAEFFGLLAILDHISIDKRFRGKGYGTKSMKEIIKYLEVISVDYLALFSKPLEGEENKKSEEKLVEFYEQFNLKIISDNNDPQIMMGRNLN